MYKLEDLTRYDYFKDVEIEYALDSLTGVVSRGYILGFAKHLVESKTPFMMAIMDIDNFKLVNDNYGHKFGDECLKSIGENLAKFVGNNGLVGRFGGDEFIILYFGGTSYNNVHSYVAKLYNSGTIVRRRLKFGSVEFYVTSTTGCASFPDDADNYDELFLLVDKALYRGKTKGRNCYIVYVESKHRNIDVHKKEASLLSISYKNLFNMINDNILPKPDDVVKNMLDYIVKNLAVSSALFIKPDNKIITSGTTNDVDLNEEFIDAVSKLVLDDEVFVPTNMKILKGHNKKIAEFVDKKEILTFMVSSVKSFHSFYGYLVLFENKIERIWQEKDVELLMYVDRLIYILYSERNK